MRDTWNRMHMQCMVQKWEKIMFTSGDKVRTNKHIWGPNSNKVLDKDAEGIVKNSYKDLTKVRFKTGVFWFVHTEANRDSGYCHRAYPSSSCLELVSESTSLEGSSFTVLEDRGNGKFLIQRDPQ